MTVTGLAPDGGIKVDTGDTVTTGQKLEISLPTGTKVTYMEPPPKGGGSDLQPGILDLFDISPTGKVSPPNVPNAVDSASHDPSIPIPANSDVTPTMWQRFGKEDQERYVYLQGKYGKWSDGKGVTAMEAIKGEINHKIRAKVESAYNAQYQKTGAKGTVVTPTGRT